MKRHFNAKFSIETEREIISAYTSNSYSTISGLAKIFSCSPGVIRNLLRKESIPIRGQSEAQTLSRDLLQRDIDKFWRNVLVGDPSKCWDWAARRNTGGYGVFSRRGKSVGAHKISWEIHNGDILEGMCVCHSCDNPACVNPYHLFLGTHAENMRDRNQKGRARGGSLPGELAPNHRFSAKDVLTMREMYASGVTQRVIAMKFGTSQPVVSNIVNRKYWRCV